MSRAIGKEKVVKPQTVRKSGFAKPKPKQPRRAGAWPEDLELKVQALRLADSPAPAPAPKELLLNATQVGFLAQPDDDEKSRYSNNDLPPATLTSWGYGSLRGYFDGLGVAYGALRLAYGQNREDMARICQVFTQDDPASPLVHWSVRLLDAYVVSALYNFSRLHELSPKGLEWNRLFMSESYRDHMSPALKFILYGVDTKRTSEPEVVHWWKYQCYGTGNDRKNDLLVTDLPSDVGAALRETTKRARLDYIDYLNELDIEVAVALADVPELMSGADRLKPDAKKELRQRMRMIRAPAAVLEARILANLTWLILQHRYVFLTNRFVEVRDEDARKTVHPLNNYKSWMDPQLMRVLLSWSRLL